MNQQEFEALISDNSKLITGDIAWSEDEDHSPSVEFRVEVGSASGYPIFVRGSLNPIAGTLTYALIHRGVGRIYALDMGKEHHNPSCTFVGEKHKHRWDERVRDKEAYVPDDIIEPETNPVGVWAEFCKEALITHAGVMTQPPPPQLELF